MIFYVNFLSNLKTLGFPQSVATFASVFMAYNAQRVPLSILPKSAYVLGN